MANKTIIVEENIYRFTGESTIFYGYFESAEQAAEWIRKNSPHCETVEKNVEYQVSGRDGATTWVVRDTQDEEFKWHCYTALASDRPCFNESDISIVE